MSDHGCAGLRGSLIFLRNVLCDPLVEEPAQLRVAVKLAIEFRECPNGFDALVFCELIPSVNFGFFDSNSCDFALLFLGHDRQASF